METKEAVVPSEAERELWKSGDKVRAVRDLMTRTGASLREAYYAFPSERYTERMELDKLRDEVKAIVRARHGDAAHLSEVCAEADRLRDEIKKRDECLKHLAGELRKHTEKSKALSRLVKDLAWALQCHCTKDVPNPMGHQINCRRCEVPQGANDLGGLHKSDCVIGQLLKRAEEETKL